MKIKYFAEYISNKRWISLILIFLSLHLSAADIYVSTSGNDQFAGTNEAPKASLSAALRQAREMRRLQSPGIENGINIILTAGTYHQTQTLVVRPEDSGTTQSPTIIRAEKREKVIISGGVNITHWKQKGLLLVADVPEFNGRPLEFRQLWINGKKAIRARDVADFENMHRILRNDKVNQVLWVPARAVKKIMHAPNAEMVLHQMWAVSFLRIKSIQLKGDSAGIQFHNPESQLQFERPWPQPMISPERNSPFYLTNALELLDEPGEWYHDIQQNKVYYYPQKNETIKEAIAPAVETLVQVEGTLDRPVKNIRFENIIFAHTGWIRPSVSGHVPLQAGMYLTEAYKLRPQMIRENNHKLDNQGWLGRPAAAINISAAKNIDFSGCVFKHTGHTALDYISGTEGGKVEGCVFRDVAGNGLTAGSFSPASHETHLPYNPSDKREICTGLTVANNLFTDITNEDWGCVAIAAGYVKDINILHNEISDVAYSGISLGWGWNRSESCMSNNRVQANLIHHYGKHMYDVAGIYTLGSQPNSIISENVIHSIYAPTYVHDPHHWFYLYTDEGSSYITIENNQVPAEKFLQNANGPGNIWRNNHARVHDSIVQQAGIRFQDFPHLQQEVPQSYIGRLQKVPSSFGIEIVGNQIDTVKIKSLINTLGIVLPAFYQWKNHLVIYAKASYPEIILAKLIQVFPENKYKLFNHPVYQFDKKKHCADKLVTGEWKHYLFTAQISDIPNAEKEYLAYHQKQFTEWPEVAEGFCRADFQQLQVFLNEKQLLLVISIPEDKTLDELNPKTVENNPRVDEWNALMKKYQQGIAGTAPGEVWVELKKTN